MCANPTPHRRRLCVLLCTSSLHKSVNVRLNRIIIYALRSHSPAFLSPLLSELLYRVACLLSAPPTAARLGPIPCSLHPESPSDQMLRLTACPAPASASSDRARLCLFTSSLHLPSGSSLSTLFTCLTSSSFRVSLLHLPLS